MKKISVVLFVAALAFTFAACGSNKENKENNECPAQTEETVAMEEAPVEVTAEEVVAEEVPAEQAAVEVAK